MQRCWAMRFWTKCLQTLGRNPGKFISAPPLMGSQGTSFHLCSPPQPFSLLHLGNKCIFALKIYSEAVLCVTQQGLELCQGRQVFW